MSNNIINLNINGKDCIGRPGQTILQACRDNGIFIPTLCHDERLNPFGSCMICRVEVEGSRGTMLACGAEITEGMVIRTDTEAVRAARKVCIELLASQHYGDCTAPCSHACPAHVDIQGYVGHIANGRFDEALALIKERNPLPIICGRICTRPCEFECRRNILEGPIGIAHLKRFVADLDMVREEPYLPEKKPATGKRCAIIGAGPAGLASAWFLARQGHEVTVYDMHSAPGGMLRYGIPAYRLPREALDREVDIIQKLGVNIIYNTSFGADITLDSLKKDGFDAVLLAVGSQAGQPLGVPGEDDCTKTVLVGVRFLGDCTRGTPPDLGGKRIVVVGGGNTAMDCARTSIRLGAKSVSLVYRRTRDEMPADKAEIEEAEHEGVNYMFLNNPKAVRDENGKPVLTLVKMELGEPDESGRRSPKEIPGSEYELQADYVIAAIGQTQDLSFVGDACPVSVTRNRIGADEKTGATNIPGVFAAGDAVTGPKTAILAIATGKAASLSIDQHLRGEGIVPQPENYDHKKAGHYSELDPAEFADITAASMEPMPVIDDAVRMSSFAEVELGFTQEQALREANRCLSCGCKDVSECKLREYATQYGAKQDRLAGTLERHPIDESHPYITRDPNKCIMCGRCVRICTEVAGQGVLGFIGRGYDTVVEPSFSVPFGDDKNCISCGQCVSTCPAGALTERVFLKKPGPFEEKVTDTVCTYCSAGCTVELRTNGDKLIRTTSDVDKGINNGNLCEKGRFMNGFLNDSDILKNPLIRKGGKLVPATMEQALAAIKAGMKGSASFYISGRATNEEAETLAGAAAALGSENVLSFGVNPMTASFCRNFEGKLVSGYEDIRGCDLIVALDCDVFDSGTVPMTAARRAVREGARYIKAESITAEIEAAVGGAQNALVVLSLSPSKEQLEAVSRLEARVLLPAAKANARGVADYLNLARCAGDLFAPADSIIIWGEDPVGYNNSDAEKLLKSAGFKAVCDVRLTKTASLADVVLPMGSFASGSGSFTNLFGQTQSLNKAMDGVSGLETAEELAAALGKAAPTQFPCSTLLGESKAIINGADVLELKTK